MRNRLIRACEWGFVLLTFTLLIYRITLHADVYDEIMNLSISYRITLGDIPFYNIQEAYQIGAIFTAPFVWLFVKLTGGTTGIILYSRVIYILTLVGCAILIYRLMKHYLKKEIAFFLSYIIVFFELFSLFYLWYDSEAVVFCLLGNLFIARGLEQSRNTKQMYAFLMLAGVLHSFMAAAHVALIPMAIGTAVCIMILEYRCYAKKGIAAMKCVLAYTAFPLFVIMAALFLILFTGKMTMVTEYLEQILASRGVGEFHLFATIRSVIESYLSVNPYFLKITGVLLILYILAWIFPKTFPLFAFAMVVLPIYNQYLLPETSVRGLPNYLSFLAVWVPFLYAMIRKKQSFDRCLLFIFWVPPILSAVFIPLFSMTSSYGPIKAWQMCLPGALTALYYLAVVWKERAGMESIGICKALYMVVSLVLLLNAYKFVYLNQPFIESENKRITEGIYWGIKVNPKMECMVDIQRMVEAYSEGCETILASSGIRAIYLMTDLKPFTGTTEYATFFDGDIQRWSRQREYFERFGGLPDIMFLEYYDLQDEFFEDILYVKYELLNVETIGTHEIYVYKKIM